MRDAKSRRRLAISIREIKARKNISLARHTPRDRDTREWKLHGNCDWYQRRTISGAFPFFLNFLFERSFEHACIFFLPDRTEVGRRVSLGIGNAGRLLHSRSRVIARPRRRFISRESTAERKEKEHDRPTTCCTIGSEDASSLGGTHCSKNEEIGKTAAPPPPRRAHSSRM